MSGGGNLPENVVVDNLANKKAKKHIIYQIRIVGGKRYVFNFRVFLFRFRTF